MQVLDIWKWRRWVFQEEIEGIKLQSKVQDLYVIRKWFILFGVYGYVGVEEDKVDDVGQSQILEGFELQDKKFGFYFVDDENYCIFFFRRII